LLGGWCRTEGADILVEAITYMHHSLIVRLHHTIVDDGEERLMIQEQIQKTRAK
jgi:hypothetical protein